MSEFTFSDFEDEKELEQSISAFIDLTVPITYRVKFNFTPEK